MTRKSNKALSASVPKTFDRLALTAIFQEATEGGYTCHFKDFPEVFSEGEAIPEAKANLIDALQLVLAHHADEARI